VVGRDSRARVQLFFAAFSTERLERYSHRDDRTGLGRRDRNPPRQPNWVRLCVRCDLATANRLLQFYREASDLQMRKRKRSLRPFAKF